MWIDCHAHIDALTGPQQEAVVAGARGAGVDWIINAADEEASWPRIAELVQCFPNVYGNMGIHPHCAKDVTEQTYHALEECLGREDILAKIIGIGEIGLDFYYEKSPRDKQVEVFERFLGLALEKRLPVVVHDRESTARTIDVMKKFCAHGLRGVIHCFTGNWGFAKEFLDMGLYLSFSGILTFRNAAGIQEVASKMPAERILVETDSPFLAPVPVRGSNNEPKNVVHTGECLAKLRGVPAEAMAAQVRENAQRLFGITLTRA